MKSINHSSLVFQIYLLYSSSTPARIEFANSVLSQTGRPQKMSLCRQTKTSPRVSKRWHKGPGLMPGVMAAAQCLSLESTVDSNERHWAAA